MKLRKICVKLRKICWLHPHWSGLLGFTQSHTQQNTGLCVPFLHSNSDKTKNHPTQVQSLHLDKHDVCFDVLVFFFGVVCVFFQTTCVTLVVSFHVCKQMTSSMLSIFGILILVVQTI